MTSFSRRVAAVLALCAVFVSVPALAEEADNFTCRARLKRDSQTLLDSWVNARIAEAIASANRRAAGSGCDGKCLFSELRGRVGASYPHPITLIPHSKFSGWANKQKEIDRCELKFSETIYGARPYNQVWMYPFHGRIIFVADSVKLSGRTVGVDKLDHFIREGLDHWRFVDEKRGDITASIAREMGPAKKQFSWTEYGLKGLTMTGVVAYADVAAGFFGYRFFADLLSLGRPDSYVAYDEATRTYSQKRTFTFADFVNDSWDESLNPSTFDPKLEKEVAAALKARSMVSPVGTCQALAKLPQASLYVNPACLPAAQPRLALRTIDSNAAWLTHLNSDSILSATLQSIVTAGPVPRPRRFATWSPKPFLPIRSASTRSVSANIIAPTSPCLRPKSCSAPSPAARRS